MSILLSAYKLMPYLLRQIINIRVRVRLQGKKFIIPVSSYEGIPDVFWTRSWKTAIIECFADSGKGVFLDVGANIGQTLLDLYLTHPNIGYIGFEPNVVCVNYLKKLIKLNKFQNCQIIPIGLTEENNCRHLFCRKGVSIDWNAYLIAELRPGEFDKDIVPCFRFDDVRHSLNIKEIGFVKIDVEGAELETLTGMKKSLQLFRPIVLCEVLFTDGRVDDLSIKELRNSKLMQLLVSMRYRVLQLVKSADNTRIINAIKIEKFHNAHYCAENKDLCDYLFVPEEKESHVLDYLLSEREMP